MKSNNNLKLILVIVVVVVILLIGMMSYKSHAQSTAATTQPVQGQLVKTGGVAYTTAYVIDNPSTTEDDNVP